MSYYSRRNKWDDMSGFALFCAIVGLILLVLALLAIDAWIVMVLWNWVMPVIFSLPTISFWQAVAIWCLSSILFRHTVKVKES